MRYGIAQTANTTTGYFPIATYANPNLTKEEKKTQKEVIKDRSQDVTTIKSVNVTNLQKVRTNSEKQPRIYDVENFNLTYAYTQTERNNPIIEKEVITKLATFLNVQ